MKTQSSVVQLFKIRSERILERVKKCDREIEFHTFYGNDSRVQEWQLEKDWAISEYKELRGGSR